MAWTKVDGPTGDFQIICARWYGHNGEVILSFVLEFRPPDGNIPWFRVKTTSNDQAATSSDAIVYGEWTHIAGTYDGTTVKIYVNGVLTGSVPLSGLINLGSQPLMIGAHSSSSDRNWCNGTIDNVMIFNKPLSLSVIMRYISELEHFWWKY